MSNIEFNSLVLHELRTSWNILLLKFKWGEYNLLSPNFIITEAYISHVGQWDSVSRQMAFSRELISKHPWNEILEVLKHEMAHQFVSEVLKINETSHGPTFQQVCQKYQIDPSARKSLGTDLSITTTNHIVEKVQHLLKLAHDKGASEAEAKTAAELAHQIMLKHNLDLQASNKINGYTIRYVGGITGRIQNYMSTLSSLLSEFYFVEIIWISSYDPRTNKRGHELEISGTEENVEVAEFIYNFVANAAISAWENKINNSEFKYSLLKDFQKQFGYGEFNSVKGYTISARSNFLSGFVSGFRDLLREVHKKEVQEGLVLAKDTGLEEFYHDRHPHIRSSGYSFGRHLGSIRNEGYTQGSSLKVPTVTKNNSIKLLGK